MLLQQSCAHPKTTRHPSTPAPHQQSLPHFTNKQHPPACTRTTSHTSTHSTSFHSLLSSPCHRQTGVEVDTLTLTPTRRFLLKEVGGNLAPTWPHYYKSSPTPALILYTINTANPADLSASLVHLLALLSWLYKGECSTRLLLLYTGLDSVLASSQCVVESVCRFTDIVDEYRKQRGVEVVQVRCSGLTGERCNVVMREVLLMLEYERADSNNGEREKRWRA